MGASKWRAIAVCQKALDRVVQGMPVEERSVIMSTVGLLELSASDDSPPPKLASSPLMPQLPSSPLVAQLPDPPVMPLIIDDSESSDSDPEAAEVAFNAAMQSLIQSAPGTYATIEPLAARLLPPHLSSRGVSSVQAPVAVAPAVAPAVTLAQPARDLLRELEAAKPLPPKRSAAPKAKAKGKSKAKAKAAAAGKSKAKAEAKAPPAAKSPIMDRKNVYSRAYHACLSAQLRAGVDPAEAKTAARQAASEALSAAGL